MRGAGRNLDPTPLLLVLPGTALLLGGGTWASLRFLGVAWFESTHDALLIRRRGRTLRLRWERVAWARHYPGTFGGRWEFRLPGGREFSLPLTGLPTPEAARFRATLHDLLPGRVKIDGMPEGILGQAVVRPRPQP